MKTPHEVREQAGEFDPSDHAFVRAVERYVSDREKMEAGNSVLFIEEYEDARYGPSALALGCTLAGRPLHILVSLSDTPLLRIITLYEPDPEQWEDYVRRL